MRLILILTALVCFQCGAASDTGEFINPSLKNFGGWGDVYYCEMTNFVSVTDEGKKISGKLERFKFTLSGLEMGAMFFGKGGYLGGVHVPIELGSYYPEEERWIAFDRNTTITFKEGMLMYTDNYIAHGATLISAKCDKF